jgi:hypothetical protein
MGMAVFGLFAPFVSVLALAAVAKSCSSNETQSLTVRGLRWVIAATCGFAIHATVSVSLVVALFPLVAALSLALLDPVLWGVVAMVMLGLGSSGEQ